MPFGALTPSSYLQRCRPTPSSTPNDLQRASTIPANLNPENMSVRLKMIRQSVRGKDLRLTVDTLT